MHCFPAENVVPLFTYCLDPPCLVFQYMENGTLDKKLQDSDRPLNWKQRANISVGIARGLHHLHANNVVHGDIKGTNILLDKHLEPKIGDFGTTRLLYNPLSEETLSVIHVPKMSGTPYYLPNWYIAHQKGHNVRTQVDVYSFGIVLLEIMSGKLEGNKDSHQRTLREFVDTDIVNEVEPPDEYIATVDEMNRKFTIFIEEEEDGQTYLSPRPFDWAEFMFDVGRQCTMHNQNPWKEPLKDETPWLTMKSKDITMESIHEQLENSYDQYINYLEGLAENDATEI